MKHGSRLVLVATLLLAALVALPAAATDMASRIVRERVAGVDLILYPTPIKDVVTIRGALPAGDVFAGAGNAAVPTLTGMMLDRGTTRHDKLAIAQQLEAVGANIRFGVDAFSVSIQARSLKRDLPMVIGLLAEQLRMPAFQQAELERARQQLVGQLQQRQDDVGQRADEAFKQAVYVEGHPNRSAPADVMMAAARTATVAQVRDFHARHYGSGHLTLVLVGDLDVEGIKREVANAFDGWQGGVAYPAPAATRSAAQGGERRVELAGKTSVNVQLGQATGLRRNDADALALAVGTAILGTGFTGRLMKQVRDQEGLTYGIGASHRNDSFVDGDWGIGATFAPELLEKGIASTRRELQSWWSQGVTEQELAARKRNMIGGYQVGLSTTSGIASTILGTVQSGRELTWLDEYPRAVDALTLEQVNGSIRKYLDPEKMVLVMAGTLPKAE